MAFRLVDKNWDRELGACVAADRTSLRVVCPFIKLATAKRLLEGGNPSEIRVITRFSTRDCCDRVSDTDALRFLHERGATIRGIQGLHAKMYVFGSSRAIVTSANLTEAAMLRNHEFGFVADDAGIIEECHRYFERLWGQSTATLTDELLAKMERLVEEARLAGGGPAVVLNLPDFGSSLSRDVVDPPPPISDGNSTRAFVKFLGRSDNRVAYDYPVLREVDSACCHWACTYPLGKRPRQAEDGCSMFISRMMKDPDDMMVFGRATGMRHVDGRDDASKADIQRRPWKERWPHYVRVDHPEFVAGTMANGVSLNELMRVFGADAFVSTQRNRDQGSGNEDPRRAYRRRADVELTATAAAWLTQQLEAKFELHGRVPACELEQLDKPMFDV